MIRARRIDFRRLVPILICAGLLTACASRVYTRGDSPNTGSGSASAIDDATNADRVHALSVVDDEVKRLHITVAQAFYTRSQGTVADSNVGHPCTSGEVLNITIDGSFEGVAVAPPAANPSGTSTPDTTVRAESITADAVDGRPCLIGVFTATQAPGPDATVLPVPANSRTSATSSSSTPSTTRSGSSLGSDSSSQPSWSNSSAYPAVSGKVAIYLDVTTTRVPAGGSPFDVTLVLVNGLGRAFAVPGACNGWAQVGLSSSVIPFEPASTLVGCASQEVPVGQTVLRRSVATTYGACSQDPRAKPSATFPACVGPHRNHLPPLPAGVYDMTLDTSQIPQADVRSSVAITLTRSES